MRDGELDPQSFCLAMKLGFISVIMWNLRIRDLSF